MCVCVCVRVCVRVLCVGREKRSVVGTAHRAAGRVSLSQSQLTADDMQSAVATALVSLPSFSLSLCHHDDNNDNSDTVIARAEVMY